MYTQLYFVSPVIKSAVKLMREQEAGIFQMERLLPTEML